MKKLIITILFSAICVISLSAQTNHEPKLTPAEKLQAQKLAARFYNRLAQTQDVEPLIKEFFIKDFGKWYKNVLIEDGENETRLKRISNKEIERFYASWINYFYLYFNTVNIFQMKESKISDDDSEELVNNEIGKEINSKKRLDKNAFAFLEATNNYDPRVYLSEDWKIETLIKTQSLLSILRAVELKLRQEAKLKLPKTRFYYLPKDFEVEVEQNNKEFSFLTKTENFVVWNSKLEHTLIPCFMTLIKENGKLKVVIITPPPQ